MTDNEAQAAHADWHCVELSHVISDGMVTYPGLPAPQITPPDAGGVADLVHLTRLA